MIRATALAIAAVALSTTANAQVQLPCIAQEQAAAIVTFSLPSLLQGVAQRCAPELPPASYLMSNARALGDRWRGDAGYSWPQARSAISRLFRQFLGQDMPAGMDGDLLRTMAEPMLGSLLAKRVSLDDCGLVDAAARAIAPLSGQEVGRLAVVAVLAADRKDKGIAGVLHICRPEPTRREPAP